MRCCSQSGPAIAWMMPGCCWISSPGGNSDGRAAMIVIPGRANSSNVKKVLWLFDEIGLPFERVDRGGKFGGLDDHDNPALNPTGLVPKVNDLHLVLEESHATTPHYPRPSPGAASFPKPEAGTARTRGARTKE